MAADCCTLAIWAALLLIPLLIALYFRLKKPVRRYEGISGPRPSALYGNWWKIWKKNIEFEDVINAKVFGNIYENFEGNTSNLIISDPEIIRTILVKEKESTCNSRATEVKEFLSQCLLSISNDLPENESRKKVKSLGSAHNLRNIIPSLKESCNRFRELLIKQSEQDSNKIEITCAASKLYDDIISSVVFGLQSSTSANEIHKFSRGIYDGKYLDGFFNTFVHIMPSLRYMDNLIASDSTTKFFSDLTKESLKELNADEKEKEESTSNASLISLLANLKVDNKSLEDEEIVRECYAVVLASALILKHSLIASITTLATKEEFQERLHKEIIGQIHSEKIMSYEAIENSKYLDMFVKEILRLHPADFRIERKCKKTINVEKLEISENSKIVIPISAVHRLEKFYPEAETFDPERFANDGGRRLLESYAFLPYGQAATDDSSLSIRFTLFALKYVIAQLILNFQFEVNEDSKLHIELKKGSLIAKSLPIWVTIKTR